jgi:hypothetical protein
LCQTGLAYSGDGDSFLSLQHRNNFLCDRFAAREGKLDRVESLDAFAPGAFWHDGFILFFSNGSTYPVCSGTNDPISVADLYRYDRDLFVEGTSETCAVGILCDRVFRSFADPTIR